MPTQKENTAVPPRFTTLKAVHHYLTTDLQKRLSFSKLKKDSAAKVFNQHPKGGWSLEEVQAYATLLPAAPGAGGTGRPDLTAGTADLARIKLEKEIEKMEAQTRAINFKNAVEQGKYFKKNDVWLELASRAAVLYQGLHQSLLAAVPDVVRAGRDSPEKAESLMCAAVEQALASAINHFSRPMTLDVETWDGSADEEAPEEDADDL